MYRRSFAYLFIKSLTDKRLTKKEVSAFYFKFDLVIRQFALGDVDWHLALGDMLVQQWQVGQEVSQITVRDGLLEGRSGCVHAPFGGSTRPTVYCCFFLKIETMISLTMIRKCANKESAPGQTRTPFRHDEF